MRQSPILSAPSDRSEHAVEPDAGRGLDPSCAPHARRLERSDIPQICDLFAQTFRHRQTVSREAVETCIEQTYLTSPGDRVRPASLVDVGQDGHVRGFMGIITLHARIGDRSLRGGILGNFMAAEVDRANAALRLARATITHDVDFLFTDTANQTSLAISRAMKFSVLPLHSLEWVKVLQPCQTTAFLLGRRIPALGKIVAPLARLGDGAARRLPLAAIPDLDTERLTDRPIDLAAFAARAPAFVKRFSLTPDWSGEDLGWLLDQAARKTRNGSLQSREIVDWNGRTLGLYLIYARSGEVAHALQVLALRGRESLVVNAMIRHAAKLGAVAVRGAASPMIIDGLMRLNGTFYHHVAAAVAFSRHPDLREAFQSNDTLLGGLLGESWTRLVADDFR